MVIRNAIIAYYAAYTVGILLLEHKHKQISPMDENEIVPCSLCTEYEHAYTNTRTHTQAPFNHIVHVPCLHCSSGIVTTFRTQHDTAKHNTTQPKPLKGIFCYQLFDDRAVEHQLLSALIFNQVGYNNSSHLLMGHIIERTLKPILHVSLFFLNIPHFDRSFFFSSRSFSFYLFY